MRLIRVRVPSDRLDDLREVLNRRDFDHVVIAGGPGFEDEPIVEIPLPTDAVGPVHEAFDEADVDATSYRVVANVETAETPRMETLQQRHRSDYDPLTTVELRSKARDLSSDFASYLALMVLSAIIATAGLLLDSPAVVVGSMVIAPIVGPALTASVGTVTGDWEMVRDSLRYQVVGLGVAVLAAVGFGLLLRTAGFVPYDLELTSLDLIAVRLAPGALALVVGLAAGSAAAVGLTTKGPMALIGVMIAAALIPTAAAAGIGIVWTDPIVAAGTLLLLLVTVIVIDASALATLLALGYRPDGPIVPRTSAGRVRTGVVALLLVLLLLVAVTGAATAQQIAVDRETVEAVNAELDRAEYESLSAISVRNEYGGLSPFVGPETVTVVVASPDDAEYPELATDLRDRIADRTDREVTVRVQFVEYDHATPNG